MQVGNCQFGLVLSIFYYSYFYRKQLIAHVLSVSFA